MAQVLPTSVEELNMRQQSLHGSTVHINIMMRKSAFEDIPTEKKLKREVSLPTGVENWNIGNYDSYLNFDDVIGNYFEAAASPDDRIVPEGDPRARCSSISSVSSFTEDKTFHNFGMKSNYEVKTFSTVCMDSGSTCISSDHSYFNASGSPFQNGLDPEETYQNLDLFLQEVPEMKTTDTLPSPFSPLPPPQSEDLFDLNLIEPPKSMNSEDSIASTSTSETFNFSETLKRPLESISEDDAFVPKHSKQDISESFGITRYHEIRRKNNLASKNCRKTRKEKQREMEQKVTELEQDREHLKVQVQVLEKLINAHKKCLFDAIAQKR